MKIFSFAFLRPAALFCFMVTILAVSTHQSIYSRSWHKPLDVVIYPINGDATLQTHNYINSLDNDTFAEIDRWISKEATRYDLSQSHPLRTTFGPEVKSLPPMLPKEPGAMSSIWWGLKLRFWVYRNTPDNDSNLRRIRVFVAYYKGEEGKPLAHSVGLQKGLIGVVHAFASPRQNSQNNIVIVHEVLHTVGASDKYSWSGSPIFPVGYANPQRQPLHPQRYAEVMAGKIPTSRYNSYMAPSLKSTRINEITAREIAWIE